MAVVTQQNVVLPELDWVPTEATSSRHGARVRLVVLHRWGVRFTDMAAEASSYRGVINESKDPANGASAHFVYPGSAVSGGGKATQMVPYSMKAWTEAFYNPVSVEVESADAIWLGHDFHGLRVLARITAFLLNRYGLPAHWVHDAELLRGDGGFCRHADLGSLGGGHTQCPTTDMNLWATFRGLVGFEHRRGGFRREWGR